jgi:hypothetical protein
MDYLSLSPRALGKKIGNEHAASKVTKHPWICRDCKYGLPCKAYEDLKLALEQFRKRNKNPPGPPPNFHSKTGSNGG